MIKIKTKPPPPASLSRQNVINALNDIRAKIARGERPSSSRSNDFPSYWLKQARRDLWLHQNKKCCFCQREREEKLESDLEHYRPKGKVDEEPTHMGYWWLAYDWDNYLWSCKPCNESYKGSKFPLLDNGIRAFNEGDDLSLELPYLINPYIDEPESLISFDWESSNDFFVKAVSHPVTDVEGRGKETIRIVGLNRSGLPEERARLLLNLRAIAVKMNVAEYERDGELKESAAEDIRRETSSIQTFSGFRRAFFRKWGMEEYISND